MKGLKLAKIIFVALLVVTAGCSKKVEPTPVKQYSRSYSQLPPPPTYSRLRWGQPPAPIPGEPRMAKDVPYVYPIVNLDVKKTPLEEVGMILASITHYSSFTTSEIAKRPITINAVGTLEEIGASVAEQAKVNVSIDHESKEIRFTGLGGLAGE